MKSVLKIAVVFFVLAIVAVAGVSVFSMQKATNSVKPQVSATPTPSPTQTPRPTQQPIQATESPSVPTITISYHCTESPCQGGIFADITIQNQGYSSFSTNPHKFFVNVEGVRYGYSSAYTSTLGDWTNKTITDQETYSGRLVFVTGSNASATLSYNDDNYNIVYEVK